MWTCVIIADEEWETTYEIRLSNGQGFYMTQRHDNTPYPFIFEQIEKDKRGCIELNADLIAEFIAALRSVVDD